MFNEEIGGCFFFFFFLYHFFQINLKIFWGKEALEYYFFCCFFFDVIFFEVWKGSKRGKNFAIKVVEEEEDSVGIEEQIARCIRFTVPFLVRHIESFRFFFFFILIHSCLPFQRQRNSICGDGVLRQRRFKWTRQFSEVEREFSQSVSLFIHCFFILVIR
jgi:hypothetical protein